MKKWRFQLSVLGSGVQHTVLRLAALGFAIFSALAVYWFFGTLADNFLWNIVTIVMTVCFVAMGYFVLRGLSHRLKNGRRTRSYVWVAALYLYVEIVCNLAHALEDYPAIQFSGWAEVIFAYIKLSVLVIMPVFAIVLAYVDVDLLLEKGAAPHLPGQAQPKYSQDMSVPNGASQPIAAYQQMPPLSPNPSGRGRPGDGLRDYYAQRQTQAMPPISMNGQQSK